MDIKAEINALCTQITQHNYLYYVRSAPLISDHEFDLLLLDLETLEHQNPTLVNTNSPTQRVGAPVASNLPTIKHRHPMLSLQNAKSESALEKFRVGLYKSLKLKGTTKEPYPLTFTGTPKLDGLAVALIYEKGVLVRAVTRGDGIEGEDVTANIRTLKNVPLEIEASLSSPTGTIKSTFEVRGEVLLYKRDFARINAIRERNGEKPYVNPRNAASGSLRQLDPQITSSRNLRFIAYDAMGFNYKTQHLNILEELKTLKFQVCDFLALCWQPQHFQEYVYVLQKERSSLPYEIDGAVFRVAEAHYQKALGLRIKSPVYSIAWKFPAEQAVTEVEAIDLQVGRTGTLTPVARLKPVFVGGVTVSNATLHNQEEIKRLDIRVGDSILIQRACDVIPQIVSVLKHLRPQSATPFEFPKKCPECKGDLLKKIDQVAIKCVNELCTPKIKAKIEHFVSKKALDIDGFGEKLVDQLVEFNLVKNLVDIFHLDFDQLLALDRMGKQSSTKLLEAITQAKNPKLNKFIFGLGIPSTGENTANVLTQEFEGNFEAIRNASYEKLLGIMDIGPVVAREIKDFFLSQKTALDAIMEVEGFQFKALDKPTNSNGALYGDTFVITGTHVIPRNDLKLYIERMGGRVTNTVTTKTNFLVAGEKAGSKLTKAEILGIPIISYNDLQQTIMGYVV